MWWYRSKIPSPLQEAYDEGGYESRSSNFKAGVAELLIDEGRKLMNSLK